MPLISPTKVTVLTPATSANLGPGFDSLGLALQLYNRFEVEEATGNTQILRYAQDDKPAQDDNPARDDKPAQDDSVGCQTKRGEGSAYNTPETPSIEVEGALGAELSTGPDNLFFQAFALLFKHQHVQLPAVRIHMTISIPPGCGLGSSATAVVGGLVAANEFLRLRGDQPLPREELLELAVEAEAGNHPDNVAPALLGGLVATTSVDGKIHAIKMPFPDILKAIIFTPSFPMDTVEGRKLLPASYSKADATFNTARVALLLAALQAGRYEVIGEAMQDRLHQPYRQALFPAMPDIIDAAVAAGAYGASLSGGGSSLIALASSRFHEVLRAMQETARSNGVEGTGRILRVDQVGARVINTQRGRMKKEAKARYADLSS